MRQPIKKPTIGLISHPAIRGASGNIFIPNFIRILAGLPYEIYAITGDIGDFSGLGTSVHIVKIRNPDKKERRWITIVRQFIIISKVYLYFFKIFHRIDIILFYILTMKYIPYLPLMVYTKLSGKKIIVFAAGSVTTSARINVSNPLPIMKVTSSIYYGALEKINYYFADQIMVESESAINWIGLDKYRAKVAINGAPYIDTSLFKVERELKTRRNLVGYISRLRLVKGIMDFVEAIPLILKAHGDIRFVIIGRGVLANQVRHKLRSNDLYHNVEFNQGWIPHDKLPYYLNELKLLILPSYSEGLPGIVREAMACGTVVVATPVGGVPDLIKDGETGFILEDNSPECIARTVVKALEHPDLSKIASHARKLIEDEYNYQAMVEKCRVALSSLVSNRAN